jgi:hypothetical protein
MPMFFDKNNRKTPQIHCSKSDSWELEEAESWRMKNILRQMPILSNLSAPLMADGSDLKIITRASNITNKKVYNNPQNKSVLHPRKC